MEALALAYMELSIYLRGKLSIDLRGKEERKGIW